MNVEHDRCYVVTGADSGIGLLTAQLLRDRGSQTITCGVTDTCDVTADIATAAGRAELRERVMTLAPNGIDALALVAGTGAPSEIGVRVNHFGTLAVLEHLKPLLELSRSPRVVLVSSASSLASGDADLIEACLSGNEDRAIHRARSLAAEGKGGVIYRSTKIALNRWLRTHAGSNEWAGRGIPINAVAPGVVDTASARDAYLDNPAMKKVLSEALPQPLGFPGPVEAIAEAVVWLASEANSFMTGQIVFVDGGADVILRRDAPYTVGAKYGPISMLKMIAWSLAAGRRRRA